MFRSGRYANVTATLALVIALGGTSYAALSITGRDVKNSSLTGRDVKNSSLTTSDIRNRSLLLKDFKAGQIPARSNIVARIGAAVTVAPGQAGVARAPCRPGERATGGGPIYSPGLQLDAEGPYGATPPDATGGFVAAGWSANATNVSSPNPESLKAYVICAT